jgi:hypothetical protein
MEFLNFVGALIWFLKFCSRGLGIGMRQNITEGFSITEADKASYKFNQQKWLYYLFILLFSLNSLAKEAVSDKKIFLSNYLLITTLPHHKMRLQMLLFLPYLVLLICQINFN